MRNLLGYNRYDKEKEICFIPWIECFGRIPKDYNFEEHKIFIHSSFQYDFEFISYLIYSKENRKKLFQKLKVVKTGFKILTVEDKLELTYIGKPTIEKLDYWKNQAKHELRKFSRKLEQKTIQVDKYIYKCLETQKLSMNGIIINFIDGKQINVIGKKKYVDTILPLITDKSEYDIYNYQCECPTIKSFLMNNDYLMKKLNESNAYPAWILNNSDNSEITVLSFKPFHKNIDSLVKKCLNSCRTLKIDLRENVSKKDVKKYEKIDDNHIIQVHLNNLCITTNLDEVLQDLYTSMKKEIDSINNSKKVPKDVIDTSRDIKVVKTQTYEISFEPFQYSILMHDIHLLFEYFHLEYSVVKNNFDVKLRYSTNSGELIKRKVEFLKRNNSSPRKFATKLFTKKNHNIFFSNMNFLQEKCKDIFEKYDFYIEPSSVQNFKKNNGKYCSIIVSNDLKYFKVDKIITNVSSNCLSTLAKNLKECDLRGMTAVALDLSDESIFHEDFVYKIFDSILNSNDNNIKNFKFIEHLYFYAKDYRHFQIKIMLLTKIDELYSKVLLKNHNKILHMEYGSIADQKSDAIAYAAPLKDLRSVGISYELLNKSGKSLQREYDKLITEKPDSLVIVTKGYDLPCEYIFHLRFRRETGLDEILDECFRIAKELGLKSLSMPVLGSGYLRIPTDEFYQKIHNYSETIQEGLERITIVQFNQTQTEVFNI